MEQMTMEQKLAAAVANLRQQRCDFVKQLEAGNTLVQPSIDFIDTMLVQLVPGYSPPKGKGCCCDDK
jgi:hypothetical protein